jgi:hypothetical protein
VAAQPLYITDDESLRPGSRISPTMRPTSPVLLPGHNNAMLSSLSSGSSMAGPGNTKAANPGNISGSGAGSTVPTTSGGSSVPAPAAPATDAAFQKGPAAEAGGLPQPQQGRDYRVSGASTLGGLR